MLITDNFVFVHFPKTGGMFVDGALKDGLVPSRFWQKVHSIRSRLGVTVPGVDYQYYSGSRHASCSQIPEWATGRPIIGTIRSPYDWYVSEYKFAVWKDYRRWDPIIQSRISEAFPNWPEITFKEYVQITNRFTERATGFSGCQLSGSIGYMTKEFLRCFARNRVAIYDGSEEQLVARVRQNLFPVTFLQQYRLNEELGNFLSSVGYPDSLVERVRGRERIYPGKATRPAGESWSSYYDGDLKTYIRDRERIIFSLFPEYDV